MMSADVDALRMRIEKVMPTLNEYQRRRFLAAEAKSLGRGGLTLVSQLSGMTRQTIAKGIQELNTPKRTNTQTRQMPQNRWWTQTSLGRKTPNIPRPLKIT
jgi:hypothetical protein